MSAKKTAVHRLKGEIKTRRVWLNGSELKPGPSQKIHNHSPDGFNWGYGGSGPGQLALAVCLELLKNETAACGVYHKFKWNFIAKLPQADFDVGFNLAEVLDYV